MLKSQKNLKSTKIVALLARLHYEYCIILAIGENSNTSSSLLSFGLLMCHKANEERRTLNGHHVPLMKQPPKSSTTTVERGLRESTEFREAMPNSYLSSQLFFYLVEFNYLSYHS